MEMLSEHQCRAGWRIPPHGRHACSTAMRRYSYYRFDVQPACQVAESYTRTAMATENCISELPARPPMSGSRPTTASRTRTPGSLTMWWNKRRSRARLPSSGCQLSPFGLGPLPSSRHYVNVVVAGKYLSHQWLTMARRSSTVHGDWYLDVGRDGRGRGAGHRDGLLWGCPHARNSRRRFNTPRSFAGAQDPCN